MRLRSVRLSGGIRLSLGVGVARRCGSDQDDAVAAQAAVSLEQRIFGRQAHFNFIEVIHTVGHVAQRHFVALLAAQSVNWTTGFGAAWTVFDGLANRARYRAAKVERRQAELARESTFLSIMVGVVAAEATVHNASEAAAVKQRAYDVAAAKVADYKAKAREGLIPLSDALDAQAQADLAQLALVQSRFQERIALANLELAMGLTLVPDLSSATPSEK